jgi:hypothetical protein
MRSRDPEYPTDRVPPVPRGLLAHPDPIENIRVSLRSAAGRRRAFLMPRYGAVPGRLDGSLPSDEAP